MEFVFKIAQQIVKSKFFNQLLFMVILLSAIIIGLETYSGIQLKFENILSFIDKIIIVFFTIEITLKIIANGKKTWLYFADPWNIFDFLIVIICLVPFSDTHYFAVFRVLRVLRILRMITIFPKLKLIIGALLKSIPSMGYVVMLIGILFFVYGVLGVFIFGKTDPLHFGNLHLAFITLFKILTLEGWTEIMNLQIFGSAGNESNQIVSLWPFLYFASFILIGAMIIMNLFIGVIMNSMEESQKDLSRELQLMKYKDQNTDDLYLHIISRLDDLNDEIKNLKRLNKSD